MTHQQTEKDMRVLVGLTIACVLTWLAGWQIPLMEIDAVQYANISREMLQHKSFLEVFDQGKDYLDKPPMLFWLSSVSMWIFGIHDWAYRLPSYLFSILSLYSTYRFALLYYSRRMALLSALVLASSQAMFLINHDVRTDTMLMGWVIFSIWQMTAWLQDRKWKNLILASAAIAGGMLTKGPIALMVPIFAFSAHLILTRSFTLFVKWEYLLMLVIIGVLLIPMSIGLYRQYDLHPEKMMYGQKGISGLRFFYWTQSFGRITGESTWHENDRFSFLFENLLWGFLPWTILFILGLLTAIRDWIRNRLFVPAGQEAISVGGFLVTYFALASSKAQLPHYIYVVLPLAGVFTAKFLDGLCFEKRWPRWERSLTVVHYILFSILVLLMFVLLIFPFPPPQLSIMVLAVLTTVLFLVVLIKNSLGLPPLLTTCILTIILVNLWLDTGFYPKLLEYQDSIPASRYVREHRLNKDRLFLYQEASPRSMDFYSDYSFKKTELPSALQSGDMLLTNKKGMETIDRSRFQVIDSGVAFHVTTLSLDVLNPYTRNQNSDAFYILVRN